MPSHQHRAGDSASASQLTALAQSFFHLAAAAAAAACYKVQQLQPVVGDVRKEYINAKMYADTQYIGLTCSIPHHAHLRQKHEHKGDLSMSDRKKPVDMPSSSKTVFPNPVLLNLLLKLSPAVTAAPDGRQCLITNRTIPQHSGWSPCLHIATAALSAVPPGLLLLLLWLPPPPCAVCRPQLTALLIRQTMVVVNMLFYATATAVSIKHIHWRPALLLLLVQLFIVAGEVSVMS